MHQLIDEKTQVFMAVQQILADDWKRCRELEECRSLAEFGRKAKDIAQKCIRHEKTPPDPRQAP